MHAVSVEIDERVTVEDYDLNPITQDKNRELKDPALLRTASGEIVRVLKRPNLHEVRGILEELKQKGFTSLAISFMHSYIFPDHERQVAEIAKELGFAYIVSSAATSPVIKLLRRSNAASTEAYLGPIIQAYVANFQAGFNLLPGRVDFICSDGSLRSASKFGGNDALLSGPAGGVVGIARSCFDEEEQTPIIGFDMGGTSTDVSRYDGNFDYLTESTIAGRNVTTPMLNIATVAAGGGSRLFARNGLFVVGPESAGAHPGPTCYRKGGPLTVTDANLFLGRLVVNDFPSIFGENADMPLDVETTKQKFRDLAADVAAQTGQDLSAEQVALGFLDVANETMSRPIRNATEARGFSPDKHNLVSFGGAGGQHACAIADKLGIKRVLIHKYSSVLSAYGLSRAVLQAQAFEPYTGAFSLESLPNIRARLAHMRVKVEAELVSQGASPKFIQYEESLSLRYKGTDTNLSVLKPDDENYGAAFDALHLREFAFKLDREAIIDSVHVRGVTTSSARSDSAGLIANLEDAKTKLNSRQPTSSQAVYLDDTWQEAGVFKIGDLEQHDSVSGPALLIDDTQTILVEPDYVAYILTNHVVLEKTQESSATSLAAREDKVEPIQLSVFSHRFMSIAEQMGNTLQRTSISTSIKERLDFSCAIFSPNGKLVANAPHIPLHLGSMQYAIQCQHELWKGKLQPGDSLLTNHPELGGTHLPDLTVVTPVFVDNTIAFYVASRGHHTDSKYLVSDEFWRASLIKRSRRQGHHCHDANIEGALGGRYSSAIDEDCD